MFEKKYVPETNYDSMFGNEIVRSLERIEDLNDENSKADREIELKALEWDSDISSAKRDLGLMKAELGIIQEKITEMKARFTNIVNVLRMTSTREDMEKLNKRIEGFDFENFITRDDFLRLISRK